MLLLKVAFIVAALIAAKQANAAEMVAQFGNDQVTVTDKACINKQILMLMAERGIDSSDAKAAHAIVDGKRHEACWVLVQGRAAGLVFADGDQGIVPLHFFTKPV